MSEKAIFRFNSIKSVRSVSWLGLAVLSLVYSSLGFADVWLDQDYSAYTVGNQIGTNNTPSLITSVPSNNVIVDVSGNKKLQYYKTVAASGNGTLYKLSDNLSTDRPQGYFSFKGTIGTNVNGTSYLSYVLGANDSNSMSAAASTYLQIRLYNTNPTANQLRIYSGSGNASNPTQVWPTSGYLTLPSSENSFQVWYNKTVNPMSYTNPTGVSNQVNPNSFVVYINGTLYGSNASSTGPLPPTVQSVTGTVTNNVATIGKLGWWGGSSSQPYDVTFDNIYAADSAPSLGSTPTITSPSNTTASLNIPYSYQINTDPPGATSFAVTSGSLPNGLTLNSADGLISGTPNELGGPTTVTLTASNSVGTGSSFLLSLTVSLPVNIFTGINTSLNTSTSWSLGSTPTASSNPGSYTDLVFSSTAANLNTTSGQILGKSWNVTNGNNYTFASASTSQTSFRMGTTGTNDTYPYYNSVAQADNVMLFLTNGSKLTFLPANSASGFASTTQVRNSGTLLIAADSVADFQTTISAIAASNVLTKAGAGTLIFSASNSVAGGLIVSAGTVNATAPNSLGAGTLTVDGGAVNASADNAWVGSKALTISGGRATFGSSNNYTGVTTMTGGTLQLSNVAALGGSNTAGTFTLSGGTVQALADYDMGHTFTVSATNSTNSLITFEKLDGKKTTVNGPVTLSATSGVTLSVFKLVGNSSSNSVVTKTGDGTLKLMGGTPENGWIGDWRINEGTLFVNTTSSGALGSNNAVVMDGGNLRFSKGVSSTGFYTGHGQDTALSVLAETTITLDPNAATSASNNTVSFTNLSVGTQTIHVAKGASTKSSATEVGYTDPQLSFRSASLTGQATFDVAANVETVLQAGSGSGGITKIGAGKLSLSSNSGIYAATATTTLNGDAVSGFTVTYAGNPSFPYQSPPTVTISAPASGTQATATATIDNGLVTGLTIVNPGSGYTVAPTVLIAGPGVPNSYSGPTTVNSGTLALSGSNASSITIGLSGVLETALVTSNSPTTTGSLIFNSGAMVRPVGTPTDASYTLVTSALITGNPTLEAPIPGYVLVKEGNSLKLNAGTANTAPVITAAQGFSVAENAALATVVGTVVATDADANSTLSGWTIVSGNTGSAFAINPTTGQITLAGVLNYEGTSSYSLGVTVSDGTATSAVGTVVVTVTNVVEYSDFFGSSSPTADDNGDGISNLMAYALGATSPSSVVLPPALNTADPTKLTMTALIRINDPKVSVVGIYGLTPGTWVTGSPITGVPSSSQTGAVAGVTQRQDFSVLRGTDSKKFMYLKATQAP